MLAVFCLLWVGAYAALRLTEPRKSAFRSRGVPLRVWLDDERPAPSGWVPMDRAEDVVRFLERYQVDELSLDHDLGPDRLDGYHVLTFLELEAFAGRWVPPEITIHSANYAARPRMEAALAKIRQYEKEHQNGNVH